MIADIKAKVGQACIIKDIGDFRIEPTTIACIDIETWGCNKKPGDSPHYDHHGICGIALSNSKGDACYMVVNDGKEYGGIPIKQAIDAINAWLKRGVKILLAHYAMFDLRFLLARGLDISGLVLRDTWMLTNIKSFGNFTGHKLKDIVRARFGVDTSTEKRKDEEMQRLGTQDYGDVDPMIMGSYACDDPRYSIMVFLSEEKCNEEETNCLNIYMRNTLHLIKAEARGIMLNLPVLKETIVKVEEKNAESLSKIKDLLGSADVNPHDEQAFLKYLHQKNLHPGPRDSYGKLQFVCDREYLWHTDQPLAEEYATYDRGQSFIKNFSAMHGDMMPRVFAQADGQAGFHPQHLLSVFSKGGMPLCKSPNFDGAVLLENVTRALFAPRKGYEFVVLRAVDLPSYLLFYYCQNNQLMESVRNKSLLHDLGRAMEEDNPEVISVLLRQQIEGSGAAVLEQRMGYIKAKFKGKQTLYRLCDRFVAAIPGLKNLKERLAGALNENGQVKDKLGRILKIEKDKYYRAHSILINSSNGSLLSFYLDLFARLAEKTNAHLLLAHGKEFVFETPVGDKSFYDAACVAARSNLIEPIPVWDITQGPVWVNKFQDAHDEAAYTL